MVCIKLPRSLLAVVHAVVHCVCSDSHQYHISCFEYNGHLCGPFEASIAEFQSFCNTPTTRFIHLLKHIARVGVCFWQTSHFMSFQITSAFLLCAFLILLLMFLTLHSETQVPHPWLLPASKVYFLRLPLLLTTPTWPLEFEFPIAFDGRDFLCQISFGRG